MNDETVVDGIIKVAVDRSIARGYTLTQTKRACHKALKHLYESSGTMAMDNTIEILFNDSMNRRFYGTQS